MLKMMLQEEIIEEKEEHCIALDNLFAITAYATELPTEVSSGDVIGLSAVMAQVGSSEYLNGRFMISGQNIKKVKIETDKCNLYSAVSIYEGDAEYEKVRNAISNVEEKTRNTILDAEGEEYIMVTDEDFILMKLLQPDSSHTTMSIW